jgi:hypothetical protein
MTQRYPIRIIRLVTGETLIAGIAEGGTDSYVLEHPMAIMYTPLRQTSMGENDMKEDVGVMMKDWIDFSADKFFIVSKHAVICTTKPNRLLISDYTQAKIGNSIMKDWDEMAIHETMSVADIDEEGDVIDEEEFPDTPPPNEFPGWGGDPRL